MTDSKKSDKSELQVIPSGSELRSPGGLASLQISFNVNNVVDIVVREVMKQYDKDAANVIAEANRMDEQSAVALKKLEKILKQDADDRLCDNIQNLASACAGFGYSVSTETTTELIFNAEQPSRSSYTATVIVKNKAKSSGGERLVSLSKTFKAPSEAIAEAKIRHNTADAARQLRKLAEDMRKGRNAKLLDARAEGEQDILLQELERSDSGHNLRRGLEALGANLLKKQNAEHKALLDSIKQKALPAE